MPFIFNKSVTITDPHKLDADDNFIINEWVEPRESAAPDWNYNLKPVKVSDRVWCFFGTLEMPTKENAGDMSNSCYIKGDDSWIAWDSGPSYNFAKQAYAAMSKIANLPVKTVIVSHEHDDHWLGNNYYKQVHGAEIIGTPSINVNYHKGDQTRMVKTLYQDAIRGTELVPVDKSFKETTKFTVSGVNLEYVHVGYAHSEDDWFLYLPDDKVVLVADVVMNGRVTSNRDGIVIGQIEALKAIKSRDWNHLVPGHGFVTDKTAADESIQYFDLTKKRVLQAVEDGVKADDITKTVTLEEFRDKDLYYTLSAQNVFRAYEELEMYSGDDDEK
ncbi:MAG: MBL fold metallo-hydrolase [Campylobacterales bacterium]|nr:MBL fold metallo-hydrolase [Campylobacterales bacterium]